MKILRMETANVFEVLVPIETNDSFKPQKIAIFIMKHQIKPSQQGQSR
jgi:hypothetical protein